MVSLRSRPIASSEMQLPPQEIANRRRRVVILGAAGRDFHNFNVVYRDDPATEVVAITAAQIPCIAGRCYPPELAGPLYPRGIPIVEEAELEVVCRAEAVDQVVFAYSDVSHQQVMHLASRALALGADFMLLGPKRTMLHSCVPVIAVCATRTGCGKSSIARWFSRRLRDKGRRTIVIRHPMPYGDLIKARVQRFASFADLDAAQCTAEEREEYEPHIAAGDIVLAGVDYGEILRAAEREADIIVWEGGNNDFPFVKPDLHIVVADALRPRQIATHHPGEAVARMADVLVINKVDTAAAADVEIAEAELSRPSIPEHPLCVRLRRSGWTMHAAVSGTPCAWSSKTDQQSRTADGAIGAGYVAAMAARSGARSSIRDRRPLPLSSRRLSRCTRHIGNVLPALGYAALHSCRRCSRRSMPPPPTSSSALPLSILLVSFASKSRLCALAMNSPRLECLRYPLSSTHSSERVDASAYSDHRSVSGLTMTDRRLSLFALHATAELGAAVAAALDRPLAAHEEREFEDGEHKARPLEAVRGADVFVLQSLHGGPEQSANDKLCRLLFFIGALKDSGAARVTALVPYLCYARKDRRTKPE